MAKKEEKEVKKEKLDPMIASITNGIKGFSGIISLGGFIDERPKISTGSLSLDLKLAGGLGSDRIIEMYGPPASFKTSMALLAMKSYVDKFGYDRIPYIFDMERTMLASFVAGFGLDPNRIMVARPRTAEETMQMISNMMETGKFGLGILDSVDALESVEDVNKAYGEASMMKLPKLLSEAMRDLSKSCVDNNAGLILINQCRQGLSNYQAVEKTSGGNSIPYYASQRLRLSNKGVSENISGAITVKAMVKKNKFAPIVIAESEMDFYPGKGVDMISDFLDAGMQLGVITRAGPYYSLMDNDIMISKVQGRKGLDAWLQEEEGNVGLLTKLVERKHAELLNNCKPLEEVNEDSYEDATE